METEIPKCPVETTMRVIGGKWKILILFNLRDGVLRFSELRRRLPGVTQKMLTAQLRELEADHMITRKVYAQVPPKVEYALSDYGKTLEPVLAEMCNWGNRHRELLLENTSPGSLLSRESLR